MRGGASGKLWGCGVSTDVPEWLALFLRFLNNLFSINSSKFESALN